jgi:hypothetical protein
MPRGIQFNSNQRYGSSIQNFQGSLKNSPPEPKSRPEWCLSCRRAHNVHLPEMAPTQTKCLPEAHAP